MSDWQYELSGGKQVLSLGNLSVLNKMIHEDGVQNHVPHPMMNLMKGRAGNLKDTEIITGNKKK